MDESNRWKDPEQHERQAAVVARSRMWDKATSARRRREERAPRHELLAAALAGLVRKLKA